MQTAPKPGTRYDEYEPRKYRCISVDDDLVEPIDADLSNMECYWHTLDAPGKGLAYCGITLIPPHSIHAFIEVIRDNPALSDLLELLEQAQKEHKWVIHFGL